MAIINHSLPKFQKLSLRCYTIRGLWYPLFLEDGVNREGYY